MSIGTISVIGIIVSIVLIMILAFRHVPLYVYAPACACLAALFSQIDPYTALSTSFVTGLGTYVGNNFLLFLSSAVFAAFMDESGAARCIALKIAALSKKTKYSKLTALLCMALVQLILTAGGINVFVVIFLLVSLNKVIFEELDIPWNLFLANGWASSTCTVWAFPGMPSIQNLIPTEYLGTTPMAAPGLGMVMGIEISVLCILYVNYCLRKAERNNEHFLPQGEAVMKSKEGMDEIDKATNMKFIPAIIPSVVVLVTMNALKWQPAVALLAGSLVSYVMFRKNFRTFTPVIGKGMKDGLSVLLPVAFMAGYGAVIASTQGYKVIIDALQNIPGPEVVQVYVATNVAAGVCGSVSGGLGIVFTTMGSYFKAMSLSPEIIHRIAVAGASGLDTMPHAASIQSLLGVAHIEFNWQSYKHLFMVNLVLTMVTGLTGVLLVALGVFH